MGCFCVGVNGRGQYFLQTFTVKKAKVFAVYFVDWKIITNFVPMISNINKK